MSEEEPTKVDVKRTQTGDMSALTIMHRAEIDTQIETALRHPRSIEKAQKTAISLATLDEETAGQCGYLVPRAGKSIVGPSIRLAEIMAHSWGNLRCASRIVDETPTYVVAQGIAHDLETNVAISREVRRGVMSKPDENGRRRRYTDDMVNTTANAASSIALRNAVFAVVPKAFWQPVYDAAMQVSGGDQATLEQTRDHMVGAFKAKWGLQPEELCKLVERPGVSDLGVADVAKLRQVWTALDDGDLSVDGLRAVLVPVPVKGEPEPQQTAGDRLAAALRGHRPAAPAPESPATERAAPEPGDTPPDAVKGITSQQHLEIVTAYMKLDAAEKNAWKRQMGISDMDDLVGLPTDQFDEIMAELNAAHILPDKPVEPVEPVESEPPAEPTGTPADAAKPILEVLSGFQLAKVTEGYNALPIGKKQAFRALALGTAKSAFSNLANIPPKLAYLQLMDWLDAEKGGA